MFCHNCGSKNEDGSAFCQECGTALKTEESSNQPTQKQQPVVNATPQAAQQSSDSQVRYVQRGCLGSAWDDIRSTPHWFKHCLFLGVVNMFFGFSTGITGYCLKWGDEIARGKNNPLPKKTFDNKAFLTGLIELATWIMYSIIFALALMIAGSILGGIPFVGFLIVIGLFIFNLFLESYISLSAMRATVLYDLGRSFDFKEIKKRWKGHMGSMFGCYIGPKLICGIIVFLLVLILGSIVAAVFAGMASSTISSISSASKSSSSDIFAQLGMYASIFGSLLGLLGGASIAMFVIILIAVACSGLLGAFEKLLRYRALGYWVARNAKEWTTEEYKQQYNE